MINYGVTHAGQTSSGSSDGIASITSKLDSLGRDMKKLKENVHVIQEVKYGEVGKTFPNNGGYGTRYRMGPPRYYTGTENRPPLKERITSLEETINNDLEESARKQAERDEWLKKFQENTKRNLKHRDDTIRTLDDKIGTLTKEELEYFSSKSYDFDEETQEAEEEEKAQEEVVRETQEVKEANEIMEALVSRTMESLREIRMNLPLIEEIRKTDDYAKHMKNLVVNKPRTLEEGDVKLNAKCLWKLKPLNMTVEMADRTKSIPKGIVENLLVKIDKFIFSVDFVILDIVKDFRMPIILERPLLATAHSEIDVFRKLISLELGNEKQKGDEHEFWASCDPYDD
ncbi:zinc knuckle CX2CX4HX4C containing protein [Tanacetum coccineum]